MTVDDAYNAVMDGKQDALEGMIRSGLQPTVVAPMEKWNLLHMALMNTIESPPPRMVNWLIGWGVEVNAKVNYSQPD